MRAKTTTIFFCDFCGKLYQLKHNCEKHEHICNKNPINTPKCYSCANFEHKRFLSSDEIPHYYDSMFCSVFNLRMKPIISAKKGRQIIGQTEQAEMITPKKCEFFKGR